MARSTQKSLILLLLLLIPSLLFGDDLLKVKINLFQGGQNSFDLADTLDPSQGVRMTNVVLNKKGQLLKRNGQHLFANDVGNTAFTGIGEFNPDINTQYSMAASGVSVIRSVPAGTDWVTVNPSDPLTAGKDTEFVQANNLLFVMNGQEPTAWYNGSAWTAGTVSSTTPPICTTAAWLRNYMFYAGNPTNYDWVYFSNNLVPQTLSGSDIMKINTGDGQKIVKLLPFKLNELIVYKEKSIYNIDITGETPLVDWTIQPVTRSIGCVAPRSVVDIGNDHWFLSSDPIAVRNLSRTQFDKILVNLTSRQIQDIFDGTGDIVLNKTYASKACAVLFDNKYVIAIATGTSAVNNYVLVYDFISQSWYTIDGWFPAAWQVFNNRLFYIDANDGRVVECFTGTSGDMTSGPTVTSASEPALPITYTYVSKNIDFDNENNYKQLDAIDVEFEATGDYTATLYIELDNSGFQNVGTVNLKGGGVTLPVNLPFTLTASGVARKTFQLQRFGEFKKIKVKLEQSGLAELCGLHNFTCYARLKNWRRE